MTTAHLDSDRLADAAGHSLPWSDMEAAHLAVCAECRLELEMVRTARRLGGAEVAGLNATRIVAGVRSRLVAEPARRVQPGLRHPGRWLAVLAAAAAVILAVQLWFSGQGRGPVDGAGSGPVEISLLHELDGLSEPQLEAVLAGLPAAAEAIAPLQVDPIGELNADDLERVLRTMEE